MKNNYIVVGIGIAGLAALIAMLNLTSPTDIGPLGVLLFFTTLYTAIFGVTATLLGLFYRFVGRETRGKDYLYSAVLAFGPIMLMMARSFGVVTPWTISLIVVFLFLAEFLVMKRV